MSLEGELATALVSQSGLHWYRSLESTKHFYTHLPHFASQLQATSKALIAILFADFRKTKLQRVLGICLSGRAKIRTLVFWVAAPWFVCCSAITYGKQYNISMDYWSLTRIHKGKEALCSTKLKQEPSFLPCNRRPQGLQKPQPPEPGNVFLPPATEPTGNSDECSPTNT